MCAISPDGCILDAPSVKDLRAASSIHVLAFSSKGDLLVSESEGHCDFDKWEEVFEHGRRLCQGHKEQGEDADMNEGDLNGFVRGLVREKVQQDQKWMT
jgi:exosome complex component RRP46